MVALYNKFQSSKGGDKKRSYYLFCAFFDNNEGPSALFALYRHLMLELSIYYQHSYAERHGKAKPRAFSLALVDDFLKSVASLENL